VGLRYFNVFGPRQHPHGAYAAMIPRFILGMLRDEQPTVFGDGEQTRDFTHVDNVVTANLLAIERAEEVHGRVINVGCGSATSVNGVAASIHAAVTSLRGAAPLHAPLHAPEREGEVRHSTADISLAGRLLGYRPGVQVDEGLEVTVRWYADHLDRYTGDAMQ
jgi:nucleoside-diphosphate-sugar epimerase